MKTTKHKNITLENYTHNESKRINNPPVGLVSSSTDNSSGVKKYQHDPHIDPELSWAGKVEGSSFEVPNVSLHIHERIDPQKVAKSFIKKRSQPVQASLFENPYNELPLLKAVHFYQHEQDWSNRLVAGDSLLVMNSLLQKEGMAGKTQMIYIDPPYGVKYNSNFQPFIDKRDVKDNNDADIPAEPEMIQAFRDTWELGIHSYLTHLYDRLILAKELLNETGSCFVQISDENVHYVRKIMDEIFGSNNFCSQITFVKNSGQSSTLLSSNFDYIVWYAKDKTKVKYHQLFYDKSAGSEYAERYEGVELPNGERRPLTVAEKRDQKLIPDGGKLYTLQPILSSGASQNPNVEFEFNGKIYTPGPGRHWKTSIDGLKRLASNNRIVGLKTIYYVRYLNDFPAYSIGNNWEDTQDRMAKSYVVETVPKVIQRCMLMTTDPEDLVLDPTCGSGTTAFVAEQWGRRWITCDTSRVAITLAKQRILAAQFDYYELAHPDEGISSGFKYKSVPHITLGSIANNEPQQTEFLYDQPIIENGKVRVSGPFTVEAVPSLRTKPFDGNEAKIQLTGTELARSGSSSNLYQWIDEMKATGIRATGNKFITFGRIEPTSGTKYIHADAEILTEQGEMQKAVISFGPDYGPIEQRQIEEVVDEAKKLKDRPQFIIFAAFHFDPEAAKDIDQINNSKSEFTLLKTQMSVDLLTHDLRKKRSSNQSYWLIGQPDVEIVAKENNTYEVKVNGFDYYNPISGEIESGSTKQIAMWMLDTDYDEQSIFPDQIFFPVGDGKRDWTKLAKALNGTVDEDLLELFTGTVSKPFIAGENNKIAVKIIDNRGIESFVVKSL